MNIYVGNLPPQVVEQELETIFKEYGSIQSVKIIRDNISGDSRGFGFIEMYDRVAAKKAIESLNSKDLRGNRIVVNEARPKTDNRQNSQNRSKRRW